MRAAFRARYGMDFVQDQRVDRPEDVPGLGGEHQEERLWRRDQDVGRMAEHLAALFLGRVARPHRDSHLRLEDRKSTRLNSSHTVISYAVFCLKKKKITHPTSRA